MPKPPKPPYHDDWTDAESRSPQQLEMARKLALLPPDFGLVPVMNDTKWRELRAAMMSLEDHLRPQFRIKAAGIDRVYPSRDGWDGEWVHHFRGDDSYVGVEWVDLAIKSDEQRAAVLTELKRIHLPGTANATGYRIFGYVPPGTFVDYIA